MNFRWGSDLDTQRWIRWMDAEVFPEDCPVTFHGTHWVVGWEKNEPACYAAWRPHYPTDILGVLHWPEPVGFLYRAGVLEKYRGRGLQRQLITLREANMAAQGIKTAVTYTEVYSIASMKNLIASGYEPYWPDIKSNLAEPGRHVKMVHWRKEL